MPPRQQPQAPGDCTPRLPSACSLQLGGDPACARHPAWAHHAGIHGSRQRGKGVLSRCCVALRLAPCPLFPSSSHGFLTFRPPCLFIALASSEGADRPVVEVLLMVPWVVLSELDLLKHSERKVQSAAARNALHRLRALTARRDTCVRLQPAAEHQQVGGGCRLVVGVAEAAVGWTCGCPRLV